MSASQSPKRASLFAAFDDALEQDGFSIPGYEILGEIDRGGMGVVYRAMQLKPEREVALKVMLPKLGAEKEMRKRFQREAHAMAALDHPGILPIYEVGESNGLPFFSMKLASDGSMADRLQSKPIDVQEAVAWMCKIASAVYHAHQRGVLHRDLKPANFLFDGGGRLYVADFGVAKLIAAESADLTRTDGFVGTPFYMPPEVAGGSNAEVTVLGDLYSLGAVFYECLTGRRPHANHSNMGSLLRAITDEPIPSPRHSQPGLPLDLDVICQKALEKSPGDRYSSVRAFQDDLQRWQEGRPIMARPVRVPERVWRWSKRHPLPASLAGLLVCLSLVGSGLLIRSNQQQGEALRESWLERARAERLLGNAGFRDRVLGLLADAHTEERSDRVRSEAVATLAKIDVTSTLVASPEEEDHRQAWPPALGSGAEVVQTQVSPSRDWTLSWHANGQLALWEATTEEPMKVWRPAPGQTVRAEFLTDRPGVLVGGTELGVAVYSGDGLSIVRRLPMSGSAHFSVSPRVGRAAFGEEGLVVIDLDLGQVLWSNDAGRSRCPPSWSADGRYVAACLGDMKEVTIYDAEGGTRRLVRSMSGWPERLAFHPGGQLLAVASDNDTLTLMDLVAGNTLESFVLPSHPDPPVLLHFSEDGESLRVEWETDALVWQIHHPIGYHEWSGHAITSDGTSVSGAKLSPDERFLLTMASEGIKVWDVQQGRQTASLPMDNQRIDARTDAWWLMGATPEVMVQVPGALKKVRLSGAGEILSSAQVVGREPGTAILDIRSDGAWHVRVLDEDGNETFECWPDGDPSQSKPVLLDPPVPENPLIASNRKGSLRAEVTPSNVVRLTGNLQLTLTPPVPTQFRQVLFADNARRLIGLAEDYRVFHWDLEVLTDALASMGFE